MPAQLPQINIFWFRRDLRLSDNHGLYLALNDNLPVLPVFIFDKEILDKLEKDDFRVTAIYKEIERIHSELGKYGSTLKVMYGTPRDCFNDLTGKYNIKKVFANSDYEPYGIQRDEIIKNILEQKGISFRLAKDHVIFEKDEVVKDDGNPYTVFTPYMRKWKETRKALTDTGHFISEKKLDQLYRITSIDIPSLQDMHFKRVHVDIPDRKINENLIMNYHNTRDFPALNGTSRLGFHLRFGTISIRELVACAEKLNEKFLNELIWREFYMTILWHFPYVTDLPFKREYNYIPWINNEKEFERWRNGETGIPLVDAGIRELNSTGYMHNRVRMITAGFLVKNLLIDWRGGEAYFASRLLDFELSSNNGGWQWAAGTGVDAAPYFRVFNPDIQVKKYDPKEEYIRKWIPEYKTDKYPSPLTDLKISRQRAIEYYRKTLQEIKNK